MRKGYRPVGKVYLGGHIPVEVHQRLVACAKRNRRTLLAEMLISLERHLDRDEARAASEQTGKVA